MNKQSIGYTILFSFVVCFGFVFLLSMTHEATREQVQLNQELRLQRSVLRALSIDFESDQQVIEIFADIETVTEGNLELFRVNRDGEVVYAKIFSGSGVWGTINGAVAVDGQVSRIVGLEIIDHNETPGLGGRIDEQPFKDQFRDKALVDGTITVVRGGDTAGQDGRVDAITGATGTSNAMQNILNAQIEMFKKAIGGRT